MTAFEEVRELATKHGAYTSIPPKTMSRKAQVWCARVRYKFNNNLLRAAEQVRIQTIPGWTWDSVYHDCGTRYVRMSGPEQWIGSK